MKLTQSSHSLSSENSVCNLSRRARIILGVLGLVFLAGFIVIAAHVWRKGFFSWDQPAMLFIHGLSRPWLDTFMRLLTQTGGWVTAIVFPALAYWLLRSRKYRWVVRVAAGFLGAVSLNAILKIIFSRPRPAFFPPLAVVNSFSFPSGHTVAAVTLYGLMAYLAWCHGQKIVSLLLGGLVFLIPLSRIYLGVHFPSDVLGGYAFGGFWMLSILVLTASLRVVRNTNP